MERLNLYNSSIINVDIPKSIISEHPGTVYIGLLHLSKYTSKINKLEYSELSEEYPIVGSEAEDVYHYTITVDSHIHHQSWLGPWDLYISIRNELQDSTLTVVGTGWFEYVPPFTGVNEFSTILIYDGSYRFISDYLTEYSIPKASIIYPAISYLGGQVTPTIKVEQTRKVKKVLPDGTTHIQVDTLTEGYIVEYIEGTTDGTVTAEPTESVTPQVITTVTARISMNGKVTTVTTQVLQESVPNFVAYGLLHSTISGFTTKQESLVSRITPAMLQEAIRKGHIVRTNIPTEPVVVYTNAPKDYFICLIPSELPLTCKQFDGLSAFVDFSASPDQFANGYQITIDNKDYKLYAQYAAAIGTEFKFTIL